MGDFNLAFARATKSTHYAEKLSLLEDLEKQGVPSDMKGSFYSEKGHCLVMTNAVKEGIEYLRKAVCAGESMGIFEQRCAYSSYLMALHYLSGRDVSDEELRQAHFLYGELFPNVTPYSHAWRDREKIRVGYLGNNLSGCVEAKFIVPLLACYNRERYEVALYDVHRGKKTWMSERFLERFSGSISLWREFREATIEEAAQKIYEDGIDILFDLEGHTMSGITLQIAAYKPAPIQICGIGYFNTTGLPAIDYFLGDVYCDVPGAEASFSEKLLRMPHSHFCYDALLEPSKKPGDYRAKEYITFGSFNNFSKITDEVLELWHRVVERVPGSRILLKNVRAEAELVEDMHRRVLQAGFREEQAEVRPATADGNYMDEYMEVDIALDTFPYTGGGTTCDALYMGVPVISLYGTRHGSRFGYSLLSNVGIGELAASTPDEYVEKAAALASDAELLTLLHHNLRDMMRRSPVMDMGMYVSDLETIYERVWEKWMVSGRAL